MGCNSRGHEIKMCQASGRVGQHRVPSPLFKISNRCTTDTVSKWDFTISHPQVRGREEERDRVLAAHAASAEPSGTLPQRVAEGRHRRSSQSLHFVNGTRHACNVQLQNDLSHFRDLSHFVTANGGS